MYLLISGLKDRRWRATRPQLGDHKTAVYYFGQVVRKARMIFTTSGVTLERSSDGGPEFSANETRDFLYRCGVHHRLSSAHHPQLNGWAELTIEATKHILRDIIGNCGNQNTGAFVAPHHYCKLSIDDKRQKFDNEQFRRRWRDLLSKKETEVNLSLNAITSTRWTWMWIYCVGDK